MRKFIPFAMVVGLLLTGLLMAAAAQESSTQARDLYLSYGQGQGSGQAAGRPGTKITIERMRDGRVSYVSPDTTFYSGDRIKFHFTTNFSGYVAILQEGSTGRRSILFPYRGADNRVAPRRDNVIPGTRDDWITFDRNQGTEKLTFIMSKNPLAELGRLSAVLGPQPGGGGSTGGQVTPGSAEEQQILNELNSRALDASRDLTIQTVGNSAYAVAAGQNIGAPVGFTLRLAHR